MKAVSMSASYLGRLVFEFFSAGVCSDFSGAVTLCGSCSNFSQRLRQMEGE